MVKLDLTTIKKLKITRKLFHKKRKKKQLKKMLKNIITKSGRTCKKGVVLLTDEKDCKLD